METPSHPCMTAPNASRHALPSPQLFSVQAELPVAQAVAVAAHTGCTARAALAFWKEQRDAWAQVMREAAQRAAAAAAAAAAAEGQAGGNGKAASVGAPQANQDVQGLIDALAAARAAATAKLRALQDASGEGLRDASVTGKCCEQGLCQGLLLQHCGTLRRALESTACRPPSRTAGWWELPVLCFGCCALAVSSFMPPALRRPPSTHSAGQFVSLIATLSSAVVRCRACAAITASSKLIRRKLVAAGGCCACQLHACL